MLFVLTAIAFILLLTGLILIHEWGHFIAARKSGVIVEEFGFGLPPKAKKLFTWGGTVFTLNWIPFGGFVRLKGENALTEQERRSKGSFASAPFLSRCLILVAGVGMNFLLALILFTFGFSYGRWVPTYLSFEEMKAAAARGEIVMDLGVLVHDVLPDGTAAKAGVAPGSVLSAINGVPVTQLDEVVALQEGKRSVVYTLLTGKKFGTTTEVTVQVKDGKTGVSLTLFPRTLDAPRRSLIDAFGFSLREAGIVTVQTVIGLGKLVTSLVSSGHVPEGITGIVGIAQLTYASVQEGLMMYLRLVALLSLSLAALNILPFPALDGGRLLFVLLESLYRTPSMRKVEVFANMFGFVVLLLLILLVTFYDVLRLFA